MYPDTTLFAGGCLLAGCGIALWGFAMYLRAMDQLIQGIHEEKRAKYWDNIHKQKVAREQLDEVEVKTLIKEPDKIPKKEERKEDPEWIEIPLPPEQRTGLEGMK